MKTLSVELENLLTSIMTGTPRNELSLSVWSLVCGHDPFLTHITTSFLGKNLPTTPIVVLRQLFIPLCKLITKFPVFRSPIPVTFAKNLVHAPVLNEPMITTLTLLAITNDVLIAPIGTLLWATAKRNTLLALWCIIFNPTAEFPLLCSPPNMSLPAMFPFMKAELLILITSLLVNTLVCLDGLFETILIMQTALSRTPNRMLTFENELLRCLPVLVKLLVGTQSERGLSRPSIAHTIALLSPPIPTALIQIWLTTPTNLPIRHRPGISVPTDNLLLTSSTVEWADNIQFNISFNVKASVNKNGHKVSPPTT